MTKKAKSEEVKKPAFSFGSVEKVHDELLAASPEPQQSAIEARAEQERVELTADSEVHIDKKGTIFDKAIHAMSGDGTPSLTPTGKFRKKRGTGSRVAVQTEVAKTIQDENAARAAGQLAADMVVGGAVTLLGPEWIPIGEDGKQEQMAFDEHSNLRRAFGDYFVYKNITDFPPGIALTIALSSYVTARVAGGPETKSRLSKAWSWTTGGFKKLYMKVRKNGPRVDSGDNRVREKHAGKDAVREGEAGEQRNAST